MGLHPLAVLVAEYRPKREVEKPNESTAKTVSTVESGALLSVIMIRRKCRLAKTPKQSRLARVIPILSSKFLNNGVWQVLSSLSNLLWIFSD